MSTTFGRQARMTRVKKRITLRQVAAHLGKSLSYVSEIEMGHRYAPSEDMVRSWAQFLGADPEEWLTLANRDRRAVELPVDRTRAFSPHNDAAFVLARSWGELSEDQVKSILRIVKEDVDE